MPRRFDNLKKMFATIVAALLVAIILESGGLATWAERLQVGPWRDLAVKLSSSWHEVNQMLHLDTPRSMALAWRAHGASFMIPEPAPTTASVHDAATLTDMPRTVTLPDQSNVSAMVPDPVQAVLHNETGSVSHVALVGDSIMAVGLAPALRRSVSKNNGISIIRAYRSGTGLGRPDVFNWMVQYPQMLGAHKPDLVICAIGANDAQSFQVGRKVMTFGTPEWEEIYAQRLREFLDLLSANQAKVLWIGLPVMRDPVFSRKIAIINGLVKRTVAEYPQVTWIDPSPYLTDTSGGFLQFRQNQKGKLIRMRADDGIHLSDEGAAYMVPVISQWLASSIAAPN